MKRGMKQVQASARTLIYKVLFGPQEFTYLAKAGRAAKRPNQPEDDTSRRLSSFWDWETAKAVFDKHIAQCGFSPERKAQLELRLEQLKHHKSA